MDVSREKIFESIAKEAGEFYNLIIKIAVAFLGGTLLFAEKICPEPQQWTLYLMFFGWSFLVLAISFIAWVRLKNIESGTLVLKGQVQNAIELDSRKAKSTSISLIFLFLGISLLMVFGGVNFYSKPKKENSMSNKDWRQDSIPYGATVQTNPGGQQPVQQPTQTPKPDSNVSPPNSQNNPPKEE